MFFNVHIYELKYNLFFIFLSFFYLFCICLIFSNQMLFVFAKILEQPHQSHHFIVTKLTEILFIKILLSWMFSCFITIHTSILVGWFFCSNGFFQYENLKSLKRIFFLFMFNIFFIYVVFLKGLPNFVFHFLKTRLPNEYDYAFPIFFEPTLNNYFHFIFSSFIYLYIIFFYLFLLFLLLFYNYSIQIIINFRRFFYFKFFLISFFLEPQDLFGQIMLFCWCFIIFEMYIYLRLLIQKYKR